MFIVAATVTYFNYPFGWDMAHERNGLMAENGSDDWRHAAQKHYSIHWNCSRVWLLLTKEGHASTQDLASVIHQNKTSSEKVAPSPSITFTPHLAKPHTLKKSKKVSSLAPSNRNQLTLIIPSFHHRRWYVARPLLANIGHWGVGMALHCLAAC